MNWLRHASVCILGAALLAFIHSNSAIADQLRIADSITRFYFKSMSPGDLSRAHSYLENQCTTCHTPIEGVAAKNCVMCHAVNDRLLKRQNTSFHSSINTCSGCHQEHLGKEKPFSKMDHDVLGAKDRLLCVSCHENQDQHRKMFGPSCGSCHSVESWEISEYRHPSANNRDCAQCHAAPPSHYMEHFKMISMRVARQEHAEVRQCYLCHRTTSWNDIQGVGWYKHH